MYFPKRSSFLEELPVNEFRWKSLMAVLPAYDEVRRRCSRNEARIHRDNAVKSMLRPGVATFNDFTPRFFRLLFLLFFSSFSFFFFLRTTTDNVRSPTNYYSGQHDFYAFRLRRSRRERIHRKLFHGFIEIIGRKGGNFTGGIKIGRAMISLI